MRRLVMACATVPRSMDRRNLFAAASIVVSAILTAIGTFSGDDSDQGRTYLVVLAVILVAAGIFYWVIVPRVDASPVAALVLAVLSFVSLAVFWLGLPAVVAGAATLVALDARERGYDRPRLTLAALIISGVVVVLAVVLAFTG
jgi:hypothetical protein